MLDHQTPSTELAKLNRLGVSDSKAESQRNGGRANTQPISPGPRAISAPENVGAVPEIGIEPWEFWPLGSQVGGRDVKKRRFHSGIPGYHFSCKTQDVILQNVL